MRLFSKPKAFVRSMFLNYTKWSKDSMHMGNFGFITPSVSLRAARTCVFTTLPTSPTLVLHRPLFALGTLPLGRGRGKRKSARSRAGSKGSCRGRGCRAALRMLPRFDCFQMCLESRCGLGFSVRVKSQSPAQQAYSSPRHRPSSRSTSRQRL